MKVKLYGTKKTQTTVDGANGDKNQNQASDKELEHMLTSELTTFEKTDGLDSADSLRIQTEIKLPEEPLCTYLSA